MTNKQINSEMDEFLSLLSIEKAEQIAYCVNMMKEKHSMEEMKAFFREEGITLEDQCDAILCYEPDASDSDLLEELLKHYDDCKRQMEAIEKRRLERMKILRKNYPIPYSTERKTGPYDTFHLTPEAPPADSTLWTVFINSLPASFLPKEEKEPFRSLLGLSEAPLEAPVLLLGSLQQITLLFGTLCGVMSYDVTRNQEGIVPGHYRPHALIALPDSRGTAGAQSDDRHPRFGDRYCQFIADHVADPRAMRHADGAARSRAHAATPQAVAARHHRLPIGDASRITDAKSALLNPSRGTSLAKTAPLLKPLIALGALTRE